MGGLYFGCKGAMIHVCRLIGRLWYTETLEVTQRTTCHTCVVHQTGRRQQDLSKAFTLHKLGALDGNVGRQQDSDQSMAGITLQNNPCAAQVRLIQAKNMQNTVYSKTFDKGDVVTTKSVAWLPQRMMN